VANSSKLVNRSIVAIKKAITQTAYYLGKKILPAVLVVILLTGLSFIFTRGISVVAYSDRLLLAGMLVMLLGGVILFAQMISTSGKVFFTNTRDANEIKNILNPNPKHRAEVEERSNVGAQIWLIGVVCMVFSALVTILFG